MFWRLRGVGEVGVDADGGQAQIGIVLDDGPHEGSSSVNTLGTLVGALTSVNDQNLV